VIDGPSTSSIFGVSFLGALFAILAALLVVYTYVMLRLIPKIKRGLLELVEEIGPRAIFERANLDPAEVMRQFGLSPEEAAAAITQRGATDAVVSADMRIVFTCEDHGRCVGCPKVLAQFEAIVRHQGEETFDEVERKCYAQLRDQLASDALRAGESEVERQKRIAARVVEVLVREGCSLSIAHSVVWSRRKEDRGTFAGWLSSARSGCEKLMVQDEENVA
jgi:hypothetical protein